MAHFTRQYPSIQQKVIFLVGPKLCIGEIAEISQNYFGVILPKSFTYAIDPIRNLIAEDSSGFKHNIGMKHIWFTPPEHIITQSMKELPRNAEMLYIQRTNAFVTGEVEMISSVKAFRYLRNMNFIDIVDAYIRAPKKTFYEGYNGVTPSVTFTVGKTVIKLNNNDICRLTTKVINGFVLHVFVSTRGNTYIPSWMYSANTIFKDSPYPIISPIDVKEIYDLLSEYAPESITSSTLPFRADLQWRSPASRVELESKIRNMNFSKNGYGKKASVFFDEAVWYDMSDELEPEFHNTNETKKQVSESITTAWEENTGFYINSTK